MSLLVGTVADGLSRCAMLACARGHRQLQLDGDRERCSIARIFYGHGLFDKLVGHRLLLGLRRVLRAVPEILRRPGGEGLALINSNVTLE
ncbi:MAG: hypothetical protein ACK42I_10190 [Thermomicrobium sp.]